MMNLFPVKRMVLLPLFTLCLAPVFTEEDCGAHPDDEVLHDEHCAVFALVHVDDATHISVASGSWFNPATWNTGTVPNAGAKVVIDSATTVTYDAVSETEILWLRVIGTLNFSPTLNTKLKVTTVVTDPISTVTIGTAATPVAAAVTAKIIFPDNGVIDVTDDPFEFTKGVISHGYLEVNGVYKKTYCAITKGLNAGASNLKLSEVPTGWKVGDQLVLGGTNANYAGDYATNAKYHDEVLTITSIAGKTIYFTNNATGGTTLQYEHKMPTGYGLKIYVANLSRNVIFESENYTTIPIDQRGHLMLMHNLNQKISYAAFNGMGRTNKDILATDPLINAEGEQIGGGSNVRGRYAIHMHKAGTNQIAAVPTLIKGNAIVDPTSWGIVNHQSNVNIDDNVVFDYFGAAFVTEDGNELGTFNRNIAIKGRKATTHTNLDERTANFDFGYEGNGFWLQSSNVSTENNIVISCAGDAYKVFSDDASMPESHRFKIPKGNILNPEIAGTDDSIYTAVVPLRKFNGNTAYNCNTAMAFWTHMLNNDNVGDFSSLEYDPYTHTILSVVQNCNFWNMLAAGISVKYSGQVHFKNVLLLGDVTAQFTDSDWTAGNPMGGYAFITSTVTGQMIYEGLTVKGWKRGVVAGRADDLQSGDDDEYNYRNAKIIGGIFNNNTYNIFPEEGTDEYGASEYYKFPKYFEITGSPVFTAITPNVIPTSDFSYVSNGGNSIRFNGVLSQDSDPGVITPGEGNGIAAYAWNFGDGTTGFGMDPVHNYTTAGTYNVTLTVYDSQGKTGTVSKNVYVTTKPYENVLSNSGFENGGFLPVSVALSTKANVDAGWLHKSNWEIVNGKATIYLSDKWNRPLFQIVKNDKALRGVVEFSFQSKNLGSGAFGNDLFCEIIGINGEFKDPNVIEMNNFEKWNNNDASFSSTILFTENFGLASYNWQTSTRNINFNSGYDYIVVKFYSEGVKVGPAEEQGIDNVCLPCNCTIPQHLFEDELTASHAMLIWDNMGSEQYQVQYKTTVGGSWTTVTVENTFHELSALTANTSYTWKVRAFCDGVWTAYSTDKIFITPSAGTACTSPSVLSTSLITSNKATLNWNEIPAALSYQIAYKKVTDVSWTTINTTATSYMLTGLAPFTSYEWKVKTQCAAGWKDFTSTSLFLTLALKEDETIDNLNETEILIYPNPVQNQLNFVLPESISGQVTIKVFDLIGNKLIEQIVNTGGGNNALQIDVQQIPIGVYLLSIGDAQHELATQKFIKQ
jgi:PKD repeat protein